MSLSTTVIYTLAFVNDYSSVLVIKSSSLATMTARNGGNDPSSRGDSTLKQHRDWVDKEWRASSKDRAHVRANAAVAKVHLSLSLSLSLSRARFQDSPVAVNFFQAAGPAQISFFLRNLSLSLFWSVQKTGRGCTRDRWNVPIYSTRGDREAQHWENAQTARIIEKLSNLPTRGCLNCSETAIKTKRTNESARVSEKRRPEKGGCI